MSASALATPASSSARRAATARILPAASRPAGEDSKLASSTTGEPTPGKPAAAPPLPADPERERLGRAEPGADLVPTVSPSRRGETARHTGPAPLPPASEPPCPESSAFVTAVAAACASAARRAARARSLVAEKSAGDAAPRPMASICERGSVRAQGTRPSPRSLTLSSSLSLPPLSPWLYELPSSPPSSGPPAASSSPKRSSPSPPPPWLSACATSMRLPSPLRERPPSPCRRPCSPARVALPEARGTPELASAVEPAAAPAERERSPMAAEEPCFRKRCCRRKRAA